MNEIVEQVAINWLRKKISEFVETLQDSYKNEWYASDRVIACSFLDDFMEFVDHENSEKTKRRKLYEELKKEFGNE